VPGNWDPRWSFPSIPKRKNTLPGATPIDDISGLRIKGIATRSQLNAAEAENILKATLKYLAGRPSRRTARFDVNWMVKLHREMFGDVWRWAGEIRSRDLNIGVPFYQVRPELQALADDLAAWREITVKPSVAPAIRRR